MIHNIGLSLRDQAQCLHKDEALSAQDTRLVSAVGEYYWRVLAFTRPPLQCHVKNFERVRFFKYSVFGLSISLLN